MRSGDRIEVIDSTAQRFAARIDIDGRLVRATLDAALARRGSALPSITVAQGIPKGQKMDFVVEKLTELGVSCIMPLRSERTVVTGAAENKVERWRRLAKTAAQQCGRDAVPEICEPIDFDAICGRFAEHDSVLLPWELADYAPLRDRLPGLIERADRILLVVGPEGGFSHAEAHAAQRAGAHLLSLGERILRTETAALAVVAVLNYLTEDRAPRV